MAYAPETNVMESALSSLRLFIWVQKLHGTLPFQFTPRNIKISIWAIIYGLILCSAAICLSVLSYNKIVPQNDDSSFYDSVTQIAFLLFTTTSVISYLSYIFQIRSIQKLYEKSFKYLKYTNFQNKCFLLTAGELFTFLSVHIVYQILYHKNLIESGHYNIYLGGYTELLKTICIAMTIGLEEYLILMATLINLQFCNLVIFFSSLVKVGNEELKILLGSVPRKKTVFINEDMDISKLIDFYDEISDLCRLANKYFNIPLTLTSIATVLMVLESLYLFFNDFYTLGIFLGDFTYTAMNLWIILYSCELAATEAKKTSILVHRLLSKSKNQALKAQLQNFSLQLLHRKLKFTACGLFPLNYTLIYSITGLVTTYLVILIQFQKEEDKKTENELEKHFLSPENYSVAPSKNAL